MFGLGMGEIMIILVLALLLLGPARLPDAAKSIGKAMRDFRKATDDVKSQFESAMYEDPKAGAKPKLVDGAKGPAEGAAGPAIPPGGVPAPAGEVPPASQANVPGLEAALAEPAPQPAFLRKVIAPEASAATAPAQTEAPSVVEALPKA